MYVCVRRWNSNLDRWNENKKLIICAYTAPVYDNSEDALPYAGNINLMPGKHASFP